MAPDRSRSRASQGQLLSLPRKRFVASSQNRPKNLGALAAIQTRPTARLDAIERWKQYTGQIRAKGIEEAELAARNAVDIEPAAALFRELHDALLEDAICVDETIAQIPQILGAGAWHYNSVAAALRFAQEYGTPLLIVICSNRQYASRTWNVLKYYKEGVAARQGNFGGNVIQPTPDYVKVAEADGGRRTCGED
jgi:acetolactate synthase-1/2/3 large subunit